MSHLQTTLKRIPLIASLVLLPLTVILVIDPFHWKLLPTQFVSELRFTSAPDQDHDEHDHDEHDHDHDDHDHDDHEHDDHEHDDHDDHDEHDHDHDHGDARSASASSKDPTSKVDQSLLHLSSQQRDAVDDDHSHHHGQGMDHEESALELSERALRSIGLSEQRLLEIKLSAFERCITVPAVIVEKAGQTQLNVSAPMTGLVTHVHAVQGSAINPGDLLFQVRLTHEDLVNAQTGFVKTLGELQVEEREIERLRKVTSSGAVAGKQLLERQYSRDKLVAIKRAQREALLLHGLTESQVENIEEHGELLKEMPIFAPTVDHHSHGEFSNTFQETRSGVQDVLETSLESNGVCEVQSDAITGSLSNPLILQRLEAHKGEAVHAGDSLGILANYQSLFIEGIAFEQDIEAIRKASAGELQVTAIFQQTASSSERLKNLKIAYLSNKIDADDRTLRFYVELPNTMTDDRTVGNSRYINWRYLPGQRLQLNIPIEIWENQIVLPVDAIVQEGLDTFVFQHSGDHFDRMPVHVKYRDQHNAVIENDGALTIGSRIASRGAHQMQMALKNKAGGGTDPHAGHNH